MSDQRLRELERRFRETASPEDEAAWLRARVRAGDLDEDRLRLAAYCGHPAAQPISTPTEPQRSVTWLSYWERARESLRASLETSESETPDASRGEGYRRRRAKREARFQAIGSQILTLLEAAQPAPSLPDPYTWIEGLEAWGLEASVRAGVAAARLRAWSPARDACLGRVEAWALDPTPTNREACAEALAALGEPPADEQVIESLARLVIDDEVSNAWGSLYDLSGLLGREHLAPGVDLREAELHVRDLQRQAWLIGQVPVHAAIVAELVPWALGTSDPVEGRGYGRRPAGRRKT